MKRNEAAPTRSRRSRRKPDPLAESRPAENEPVAFDERPSIEKPPSRMVFGRPLPLWLRAGAPAWTWLGVLVAAAGFASIALAWSRVAAETEVHRQVPYLVSGGLVGLGLIVVGLAVVNIASRHRDAMDRNHQVDELVEIIEEMKRSFTGENQRP